LANYETVVDDSTEDGQSASSGAPSHQQQRLSLSIPEAWQMIQFEKRLEANTEGINKVMFELFDMSTQLRKSFGAFQQAVSVVYT